MFAKRLLSGNGSRGVRKEGHGVGQGRSGKWQVDEAGHVLFDTREEARDVGNGDDWDRDCEGFEDAGDSWPGQSLSYRMDLRIIYSTCRASSPSRLYLPLAVVNESSERRMAMAI